MTTTKEFKDKTWKFIPLMCFVYGLGESAILKYRLSRCHPGNLTSTPRACLPALLPVCTFQPKQEEEMNKSTLRFATLKFHKEYVKEALIPLVSRKS